jgi:MoaA/NifB/PqqE/SkfB family radical SAM enzyme
MERQRQGAELRLSEKMRVLENMEGMPVKVDISGGDPLAVSENHDLLRVAARVLGRESVTLTATGYGLAGFDVQEVAPFISELNFTFDNPDDAGGPNRPTGYATANLRVAQRYAKKGVTTRAECPLSIRNCDEESLRRLYLALHGAEIDKLLIMRLFPVGRGYLRASDIPMAEQYRRAIATLREMERRYGNPVVKLQCALKHFDAASYDGNPCDMLRGSVGLMADGTLLASPWAVGPEGSPISDGWVLGNLAREPLSDILSSDKAQAMLARLDENFGHCKIFAYQYSRRTQDMERIFDATDPLYAEQATTQVSVARKSARTPRIVRARRLPSHLLGDTER